MVRYSISATLLLGLVSFSAFAQNASEEVINKSFFSSGGPSKANALPDPNTFSPDPKPDQNARQHAIDTSSPNVSHNGAKIPNPELFTKGPPADQVREHAFNLFGSANKAKPTVKTLPGQPLVINGQLSDMPPPMAGTTTSTSALPNPSLFTESTSPREQVREHPIKLF
ncbi:hypothetical protein [Thiolinea disciformis]|uniref:hypothetical protein n=1 Tax=Thiolinea disciformis TaxID=125614 RepID=UPI000374B602|nr:hypothetical protein [Thiolinea disciformis]